MDIIFMRVIVAGLLLMPVLSVIAMIVIILQGSSFVDAIRDVVALILFSELVWFVVCFTAYFYYVGARFILF